MKEIWIMCADSESGDHLHACATWDHQPSKEEINREKIKLDCGALEPDQAEDADFIIDGVPYACFVWETIRKITI